ncbi:MAG: ACT domain-containing protein, partial [Ruminiclostridium sp.]|nr:ACT domain-containing protein [Ruminiclostridium sp.]
IGFSVFHQDAVFPVRSARIPIKIKNTNDPSAKGTMIVPEAPEGKNEHIITGIAGKKNFSAICLEKDEMNSEIGFLRRILTLMETENIAFEHIPTGIDTMNIIVNSEDLEKHPNFADRIVEVANPNHIEIEKNLALIAVVGRGMKATKGTATRIFAALSHANINIKMIDQGSSELNIIVGIEEADFEEAIRVIYNMFMLQE